jgi:hypothetical protein
MVMYGQYMYMKEVVCDCTEQGQDAIMMCTDDCLYCNTDKSVCATQTMVSTFAASLNGAMTAQSTTYTYTKGLEGILVVDTSGCRMDGSDCSACGVTFNDKPCNSCTPSPHAWSYPSVDIDCANFDPNAVVSLFASPDIESGLLQVLSFTEFATATCLREYTDDW